MDDWPDFRRVDWKDVYPRLLLATVGRLRRSRWRRAGEMHATDFVQTAIEKAMSRQRSWDPNRSLFQNLWQVVSSEVSHAAVSYENRNFDSVDEAIVQGSDRRENPENTAIYRSELDHLLDYLSGHDAESADVANLILNVGITKSIELSVQLKRPVHEIENIKKRLRRHCQKYQQEQVS
jgi:DNA-directed RNA polymerase specialized sigma24 family protein